MANLEHEARRYRQIAQLERELNIKNSEVANAKAHTKGRAPTRRGRMREK